MTGSWTNFVPEKIYIQRLPITCNLRFQICTFCKTGQQEKTGFPDAKISINHARMTEEPYCLEILLINPNHATIKYFGDEYSKNIENSISIDMDF